MVDDRKTAYKVVSVAEDGTLNSAWVRYTPLNLSYAVGKTTYPLLKGTKIGCFASIQDATMWAHVHVSPTWKIYQCEVTGLLRMPGIFSLLGEAALNNLNPNYPGANNLLLVFWESLLEDIDHYKGDIDAPLPSSSDKHDYHFHFCDSCKLIKEVLPDWGE